MTVKYKNIKEPILLHSNLPEIIHKFQAKALSYPIVRNASLTFETIGGARISSLQYLFETTGEVAVELVAIPAFRLKFAASGVYKPEERRLFLQDFQVLNDRTGVASKLIEVIGIGVGGSLHVREDVDSLIKSLLPGGTA